MYKTCRLACEQMLSYIHAYNGYNTPNGSCWIRGFAADVSVWVGRDDEAERCGGLGGVDSADWSELASLLETGVHGVRGRTGDSRTELLLSEGLEDECPKPRRRSGSLACDVTVFCVLGHGLTGLLGNGGYPEMRDAWAVRVFSCVLSPLLGVFSLNSLASSMTETDP